MSFLPAVRREIANRPANDKVRLTLEYLIQHGIGHLNPVPLREIVQHLNDNGIQITDTGFSADSACGIERSGFLHWRWSPRLFSN